MLPRLLEKVGLAGLEERPADDPPVAVDATALDTGHRDRGIGRYVAGLLGGFAELLEDRPDRLTGPLGAALDAESPPMAAIRLGGAWNDRNSRHSLPSIPRLEIRRPSLDYVPRWLLNELALSAELDRCDPLLYHATEPWSLVDVGPVASVATVHDLIPLKFPDEYFGLRGPGPGKWLYYRSLAAADRWNDYDRLIAISESTRGSLVRHLGADPERIDVVPNGIDHSTFRPVDDPSAVERMRETFGLDGRYVVYVGGYDYRKNAETLVRAMAHLPEDVDLVLGGEIGRRKRDRFRRSARRVGVGGRIQFIGFVETPDLQALYSEAEAFAYPSLAEGFGLQVLEAMATGCPVVAGFATSLPEVVGDAGLLANPSDPRDFGRALRRVVVDGDRQEELRQRGFDRASEFSWRRTAEETLQVYEKALREG